jgi:hypothetical protein
MDKNKNIAILQQLIESNDTTIEQKEALNKAIKYIQTEKWLEVLKILAPLIGAALKIHQ